MTRQQSRTLVRIKSFVVLLATIMFASGAQAQITTVVKPYTALYNVRYKGLSGGDIEFTLRAQGNGRFVYRSHLLPNFLGSFFTSDQAEDTSEVLIDGATVQPQKFRSEDGTKDTEQDIAYDFDWSRNQVSVRYKNSDLKMAVPRGVQDRLSIQLAAMLALQAGRDPGKLIMLEKDELQEYSILRQGSEQVRVAAGSYDTVVLKSERVGNSRNTRYWYAGSLGYVPVRAERSTKGKPDIVMELKSFKFD
jgi:hypothetical protein